MAETVKTQVWVRDVIKKFIHAEDANFLEGLPDFSSKVADNQTINLIDCGVTPDVLLNNTTYPIAVQDFADTAVPISLDKYQTKATKISDDEAYAIAFDKRKVTIERHANKIAEVKHDKAIHALAPATANTLNFIIKTTGADDGTGRKRLTRADIVNFRKKFKTSGIKGELRIVLCPDHVADLLIEDAAFQAVFNNHTTGLIGNMYGFKNYEYTDLPYYNNTDNSKLSFGGTPTATHYQASVAFAVDRAFKADGMTKMYVDQPDTQYQEWRVNFRHYYIVLPQLQAGFGVIYSAKV